MEVRIGLLVVEALRGGQPMVMPLENVRSLFLDPFGYKNILWRCIPDADGGASGGFTYWRYKAK